MKNNIAGHIWPLSLEGHAWQSADDFRVGQGEVGRYQKGDLHPDEKQQTLENHVKKQKKDKEEDESESESESDSSD